MRFPSPISAVSRTVIFLALIACLLPGCRKGAGGGTTAAKPSISAIAPRGPTAAPFVFQWRSNAPAGTVYRLLVFDAAERQLLDRETRGTQIDVTGDLQPLAASSPRFLWKVSVVGDSGEPIAQTPLVEFTVVVGRSSSRR